MDTDLRQLGQRHLHSQGSRHQRSPQGGQVDQLVADPDRMLAQHRPGDAMPSQREGVKGREDELAELGIPELPIELGGRADRSPVDEPRPHPFEQDVPGMRILEAQAIAKQRRIEPEQAKGRRAQAFAGPLPPQRHERNALVLQHGLEPRHGHFGAPCRHQAELEPPAPPGALDEVARERPEGRGDRAKHPSLPVEHAPDGIDQGIRLERAVLRPPLTHGRRPLRRRHAPGRGSPLRAGCTGHGAAGRGPRVAARRGSCRRGRRTKCAAFARLGRRGA